jgi:hypothetical protein
MRQPGPEPVRRVRRPAQLASRVAVSLVLAVTAVLSLTPAAFGTFNSSPAAAMTVSSATLAAPTGLSASASCVLLQLNPQVTLNWTATSSSFATGYQILRSTSSGTETLLTTVSGASTVSYVNTGLSTSTTYYYVLKSTKGNWTSVASNEASATTPGVCV